MSIDQDQERSPFEFETRDFLRCIERREIPEAAPKQCYTPPRSFLDSLYIGDMVADDRGMTMTARSGMWAIVDRKWTKQLAKWIGKRRCLEVMAGYGWLAKALRDHGTELIATDDYSWFSKKSFHLTEVLKMGAAKAVKKHSDCDILIASWTPFDDYTICRAAEAWGSEKPIVYIGEPAGGSCAPDEFFEHFEIDPEAPKIKTPKWRKNTDRLMIGHYL